MEEELLKYRRKKKIIEYKSKFASKLSGIWTYFTNILTQAILPETEETTSENESEESELPVPAGDVTVKTKKLKKRSTKFANEHPELDLNIRNANLKYNYFILFLKFLLWLFLYVGFLKIGFGAVYFCISCFWLIWTNTKKSKRKKGEASAYSVFNPNCEALDGTLDSAKLEKQLLFR